MKQPIYLDYAAATPMDSEALKAANLYFKELFYNPSAAYHASVKVRRDIDAARALVADVIGCKDQEVIFTAGGTEANNLAIHGIMQQFPDGNIVVSSIEHESVLEPAKQYDFRNAPVNKKGIIDTAKLADLIDEKTVLVSIMYANNEIGTIQPINEIAALIAKKRSERANYKLQTTNYPLFLHTDACQAANYLDLHVSRLGVDMMTLNGGKIYASKQSGCLYVKAGINLRPQIYGGGQESNLRSGTENVGSIIAFATMLQKVQNERKSEIERLQQIRNDIIATLSQKLSNVELNGDSKKRLPNNINIRIPNVDGERLLMELDELGLMVATGSACSASSDEPSHVLLAIGLKKAEASGSIRITLGRPTTNKEAEVAVKRIVEAVDKHISLV